MARRTKCVHRWVLGELDGRFTKWVLKRKARCRICKKDTYLREREHFAPKEDD